jgi:type II secretory pathway pseudopilin PulG
MTRRSLAIGFTLVETLVATGIIVTAIAGLTQLFALGLRFTRESGEFGVALVAAQDKLESLRALRFTYNELGQAVSDPRLFESPSSALRENIAGYFDWLDAAGIAAAPGAASYLRRWRITAVDTDDPASIAIEVCVFDARLPDATNPLHADACLATARVRQP